MQKIDQFTPENFAQKCLLKLNIDELFSGHFLAIKKPKLPEMPLVCQVFHSFLFQILNQSASKVPEEQKAKLPVFGFKSYTQQSQIIHFVSSLSFLFFCFPWPIFPHRWVM